MRFARRWLAVGALALIALLYYRPLTTYVHAKSELGAQRTVVNRLEAEKATLERRLGASTSPLIVAREARSLGYVRPGEHLFIVKGIAEWRKRERASLAPRGH
jgi:Septum formation initiator